MRKRHVDRVDRRSPWRPHTRCSEAVARRLRDVSSLLHDGCHYCEKAPLRLLGPACPNTQTPVLDLDSVAFCRGETAGRAFGSRRAALLRVRVKSKCALPRTKQRTSTGTHLWCAGCDAAGRGQPAAATSTPATNLPTPAATTERPAPPTARTSGFQGWERCRKLRNSQ